MTDEEIIAAIGFEKASAETQSKMVDSIRRTVEMRVIGILGELITDEQEAKMGELIDAGDNHAVWEWLKHEVVGADTSQIYDTTLQEYIDNYKKNEFTV